MTRIKVELEGEAYADVLSAMNNFTQEILDRIEEIESLLDKIASMTGANAETLDTLRDAIVRLEKAKEALNPSVDRRADTSD
jgi:methyl-accepting chemotaxis protein